MPYGLINESIGAVIVVVGKVIVGVEMLGTVTSGVVMVGVVTDGTVKFGVVTLTLPGPEFMLPGPLLEAI